MSRLRPPGVTIPAAASIAVADLASGPKRSARVLGQFPTAVYLGVDAVATAAVVAIVRADGVRLPNAVVVRTEDWPERFALGEMTVGEDELAARDWRIRVARWWDPRPRLPAVPGRTLAGRLAALTQRAPGPDPQVIEMRADVDRLRRAAEQLDLPGAVRAAAGLVGRGVGLTPAGDDLLAGMLAALRLVRVPGIDRDRVNRFTGRLGEQVLELACDRTPALSASLLRHAIQGEVAEPVAELLRILTGTASDPAAVAGAVARLVEMGHSSGRDLLTGVRVGVSVLLGAAARGDLR